MDPSLLTTRLRNIIRESETPRPVRTPAPLRTPRDPQRVARTLGGTFIDDGADSCLVIDREIEPDARHGRHAVCEWAARAANLRPLVQMVAGSSALEASDDPVVFVDLETTGLAGGAGTHAFLIGCGWFSQDGFQTRQFFLTGFEVERALLRAVAARIASAAALASYNGKSFDLPVLETRYLFQRMPVPFTGKPHVDMLHAARRLWRGEESCALSALERDLFGLTRVGDVSGYEIPARYFEYIRSGDAASLGPVLEHKRLDVLSLAGLAVRAAWLVEQGPDSARNARECYGLGRLYERAGWHARAVTCYERAAGAAGTGDDVVRVEALRRLALRLGRDRRHREAAAVWERVLGAARRSAITEREALHALAIYHEHRSKDLFAAKLFALQAVDHGETAAYAEAVRYRLARLDRKMARGGLLDRV